MPGELRWNPLAQRWVVVSAARSRRPLELRAGYSGIQRPGHDASCPFCPGNEEETLPAIATVDDSCGSWAIRVIPNKYPSFAGDEILRAEQQGTAPASGASEVVIFTPDHHRDLHDLDLEELSRFLGVLAARWSAHAHLDFVRHTSIIVNRGAGSGASLSHPHAQILSTPFVPPTVMTEVRQFGTLQDLPVLAFGDDATGVVERRGAAVAGCPRWAGMPFETWIVPTAPASSILPSAFDEVTADVGALLLSILRRHRNVLGDVDYNVVFRLPPHRSEGPFWWQVHVLPRHTPIAGFEIASGVAVNSVPPEDAARQLRDASA